MAAEGSTFSTGAASRATRTAPLRALMAEHRRLEELFLRHQTLLVEGRPEESRLALAQFQAALLGHMHGEEEIVLPFYAGRASIPKGGKPEYFEAEHRKLRRLVEEARAWMDAWRSTPWPPQEVVLLIEREKLLKEVMEHHDEREDHFLYPGIEDACSEEELSHLAGRFWAAARPEEQRLQAVAVAGEGPGGAATIHQTGHPAPVQRAVAVACGWLEPAYRALAAGEERFRARAPWGEALHRVQDARRRLALLPGAGAVTAPQTLAGGPQALADVTAVLDELVAVLEELTPLKRFPVQRVAEAHSAWHLLRACRRAAAARGDGVT